MLSPCSHSTSHIPHAVAASARDPMCSLPIHNGQLVLCLTSLLPNLLLERPDISLYPLHSTLQRIDVLGEQLVADAVLVDNVVVHAGAGGRGTEQEAEESVYESASPCPTLYSECNVHIPSVDKEDRRNGKGDHGGGKRVANWTRKAGANVSCLRVNKCGSTAKRTVTGDVQLTLL